MNTTRAIPVTNPEDMLKSREWAGRFLSSPDGIPVSFVLDGRAIRGIPADWNPVLRRRRIDANISETVFEGTDPATGLHIGVECTQYMDYPVVEWVAWFTHTGLETTPVIRDILAMDGAFSGASPILYHCDGETCSEEGYAPHENPLAAGDTLHFAPIGGRPCDSAFPYYRLMFEGGGLSMAVGWPGQWAADFEGLADGVHVRAGQEKIHLRLAPGEAIRTPRMTLLSWTGDVSRAVNLWRRWYFAHILPRPDGQPHRPLLACECPGDGIEFTAATEENQLWGIEQFTERGIRPDVWWIDAGWYPCYNKDRERVWRVTGTWEPDPERFPRGLKAVSDRASQVGAALLLWFEPERVRPDTQLAVEHPEWLLKVNDSEDSLLNLGIPECRQWLTDHVCKLIQNNGLKIYRQDFNFEPLEYWRTNEAQDRQGINENLYVQGYLQYWDDLLAQNPGLWLDSCASGGRRNDLETMRRSVPLHYTDYGYGDHPVKLAFHHTMYAWIPYFKDSTLSWDIGERARFANRVDSYSFHCGFAPMLSTGLDIRRDDYDYPLARKMIDIWRKASDLILTGDYYPLTEFHHSAERWVVWQFDRPETGCGLLQGIRFPESPDETFTVPLRGILSDAVYFFENPETGETRLTSGAALIRDGFPFSLPKRSGALWFYRRSDLDFPQCEAHS
ncbi:MAG: alpha-galactosidase [Candidatus Latescibacterota bacterium]